MTIKRRLEKLEPPTREAHARAWTRYWRLLDHHAAPVDAMIRGALPAFTEACELSDDGFDLFWAAYGSEGQWVDTFTAWAETYEGICPTLNTTPGLAVWPHAFAKPPPEPPGLYAELEAATQDNESGRQVCAVMSLVIVANTRAVRAFHKGDYRND